MDASQSHQDHCSQDFASTCIRIKSSQVDKENISKALYQPNWKNIRNKHTHNH